ncbi:SRPBCC family protein [Rubinisphaera margarita]|uniref:SRPBCC family protein n=1 Tax=Rubinisphaera margarita TaxID=2909586 RepID=UPI001EE8433D|nr:SRPBCC family protein [Rubinisphaera margarita]MCG6156992.1 SRPBCC family protein [Rubinisphaera margarita]
MVESSTDRIEKQIDLQASVSRVWRALTDHLEFGQWFGVNLEKPFEPGERTRGNVTYPGYEHVVMEVTVNEMKPEERFSFYWHPYAVDPDVDYSHEEPTLVEFTLDAIPTGTRLTVIESGFDNIPAARRDEAFRMNEGGWAEQVKNIQKHVIKSP